MEDISKRQQDLLKAIINQFIETAEAVGSLSLLEKTGYKISSATIRNEMVRLMEQGYLLKKHNSSGRMPTNKAWKFFVQNIDRDKMKEPDYKTKEEVKIALKQFYKEKINLLRHSLGFLSHMTQNVSISLIADKVYYSGLSQLVDIPEFKEKPLLKSVLAILEDYYKLSLMFNSNEPDDDINILVGEDTGIPGLAECSVVFSEVRLNKRSKSYIAVIGPNRMKYYTVIPSVKYIADTIRELMS